MTANTKHDKKQKSPLDDETPLIDAARGKQTPKSDFDRNRDGLYGGLPKARQSDAPGPAPDTPHPKP
ncbi:MAG: hypothetical protein JOZ72_16155 [Alphaproteobacteria bacterium]|nr:hypothetical protein [Alphaproteobacteria bacterium]